jgi:hypothetical protein
VQTGMREAIGASGGGGEEEEGVAEEVRSRQCTRQRI